MNNTIIYKNINSSTLKGLLISDLGDIIKPTRRQETMEVDGRDGDVYRYKGYDSYDKTIEIGLHNGFDLDAISNFFSGDGVAIFSNEPTKYYLARITKQINYERLVRYRKAKVKFTVEPFKYLIDEPNITSSDTSFTVKNLGYEDSLPTFILTGDVDEVVTIKVNGLQVYEVTIPPEGTITIDSLALNCYNSNADKNQYVKISGGDFARLKSGDNTIERGGNLDSITVMPKSRWL